MSCLTGSCLCGAISFEVDEIEPNISHCHCSRCRKFHGAAFATYGVSKNENFRWVCGEELIGAYSAANKTKREFCSVCGSSLTFRPANNPSGSIELPLAVLDGDIPHRANAHIFVAYKANWFDINDALPQYLEGQIGE